MDVDINTALETAGEAAKGFNKFQDIISKIFNPRWTIKQADADAYADQKKLQTIRENPDMEIVYVDGKLNARQCTQDALAFRAEQRMLAEAVRHEVNIEKVLEVTAKELPTEENISDEPVDEDWITRFFNIVKDSNTGFSFFLKINKFLPIEILLYRKKLAHIRFHSFPFSRGNTPRRGYARTRLSPHRSFQTAR